MVEKGVIRHVEEELAGGAVFIRRTRHGNRAALVQQAVVRFVLDRVVRRLLLHPRLEAAALDHEALDDAVEDHAL